MMFNVLTDPLIGVRDDAGHRRDLSLPQCLAALAADQVAAFPEQRPHQTHSWHALCVQLAALALHRASRQADRGTPLPQDAADWAVLLRGLTPDFPDDSPWHLVVPDWTKPAFLQPPTPAGTEADFRADPIRTPDLLDLLVTSKNHDLKMARMTAASPAQWLFALVSLQTMEGFLGAGNYGISRMNGGFSSRPCLGLTPSARPGAHFTRDVLVMLANRTQWDDPWQAFPGPKTLGLVWTRPWDGQTKLSMGDLDPWYIEICRRIRLSAPGGTLTAHKATSAVARIDAATLNGNTLDPWTPVDASGKSLSLTGDGFSYARLQDILFSRDWPPAPLQNIHPDIDPPGQPMLLIARGLARGQGKTDGYHERHLMMPGPAHALMYVTGGREKIATIAKRRTEEAALMARKILWPALRQLQDSADWASRRTNHFQSCVDSRFFVALWDEVQATTDDDRAATARDWLVWLDTTAHGLLADALNEATVVSGHRYRTLSSAEGLFRALRHKTAPFSILSANPAPDTHTPETDASDVASTNATPTEETPA